MTEEEKDAHAPKDRYNLEDAFIIEAFPTRKAARRAEIAAQQTERPLFNIAGSLRVVSPECVEGSARAGHSPE
jgi:hypothetical protein